MKNIITKLKRVVPILLLVLSTIMAAAQATVSILPNQTACVGDVITVPITLTGTNIYNMQFLITYNPSILAASTVTPTTSVAGFFTTGYNPTYNATTLFIAIDAGGITGFNLSNQKIVDLQFTVLAAGTAPLHLRRAPDATPPPLSFLWDDLGVVIPVGTWNDCVISTFTVLPASVSISTNHAMPYCPGEAITFTATPVNGGPNPTYQWYKNSVIIGSATATTYVTATHQRNDGYKVVMTSSYSCASGSPANSNTITVSYPYPDLIAGAVTATQTICLGETPAPLNATAASGGNPPLTYQWQESTDGTVFSNISAATNATSYIVPALTNTRFFRQQVFYTGICGTVTATTNSVLITVNPIPTVAPVANQVLCNGTLTTAVNFTGSVVGTLYSWTNSATSIGLAASGTGNIGTFTATNSGTVPVTATITVTPSYTNAGKTCYGTSIFFTIQVNPTPTVNAVTPQVVCNGAATAAITFTGAVAGTVYNWTNNTTSIGLAASGTGTITSFTAINLGTAVVTATITVTPSFTSGGVTCTGTPVTFTIQVNPTPTVNAVASQVRCNGSATAAVTFTGAVPGTVFNWTNNTTSIGLAASSSGNIAPFTAINLGTAVVTATITVTPSFTSGGVTCTGTPVTFTIQVNPTPTVNAVTPQVVCNGAPTTAIIFSGAVSGTLYSWTNSATSIGLAASGTGNIASFTAINLGTAVVTATVTVTPSFTSGGVTCTGTPVTFTIQVNPTPTVNAVANQVLCNGAATAAVTFTGAVPGTVYNWTNNTTSIGLAASGTGNITSFTAINLGTAVVTATITVTPSYTNGGVTCTGTPVTFTIQVNPTPTVNAVTPQVVCNGAATAAITFTGAVTGTVYTWTNNTTSIGLAASGTGNIASFTAINLGTAVVTATITVTPSFTSGGVTCTGTPVTFTIQVNPTPTVNTVANQVLCNGAATAAVTFTGAVPGTVYNWTNNTTSIGLAASGTGNIASFTAINLGTAVVTATITVTPSFTNGGVTCTGTPITFTIQVNPTPTVNAVTPQVVCNGAATAAITFTGAVAGTVFNWTNNTTSIGLAASGTGNIASFTAINLGTAVVTATITVTPSFTSGGVTCTGTPVTFTIEVNPTPTVNAVTPQVVCNGAATVAVTFTGAVAGTVYNWTNNTTSIGLAASGTGNIASFTAINLGTAVVTATITVTPSFTSGGVTCTGTPVTFTIQVNPTPTVNAVTPQVVCNGAATAAVTFTGAVPGTVFNWTNNTTSIGLAASGTGNIASFTAINLGTAVVTATITVTPSYTNGGVTCTGTPVTFTIQVNPTPTVNAVTPQVVCNGAATAAITFTGAVTGTVYNWTNNTTSIGLAASGTGNITSFTAINLGTAVVTATITVTPSFTSGGVTCTGTPVTFTIQVNPTPTVNTVANQVLCNGAATAAVTFTGAVPGTVYNWTNNTTSIGLAASGTGNIASFTAINLGTAVVTATITVTPSFTNGGVTCTGTPITFTIQVMPAPVPVITGPVSVCVNSTGNVYITESGMTGYTWIVTGGVIVGSSAGNSITVTWNTVGSQSVSVNYTNSFGCTGIVPTVLNVTVNPLPVPTITGPVSVCFNSTGNIYITEPGMTGYAWTVAGGVIVGSSAGNSITVTWNTLGAQSVSVSYTNANGCTAAVPTVLSVTVNPLPVPTITGPLAACVNSTGNVYITETGMTGYTWTVTGGVIVGSSAGNSITVTWNTVGSQSVSVNYTNVNGCTAVTATVLPVTVNPLPVPTITGPATACASSTGNIYFTEPGMTGYTWTVVGGVIVGSSAGSSVTVTWNTVGSQSISVNYTDINGCTAVTATVKTVTVYALPTPTISGLNVLCAGTSGVTYMTEPGMTGYTWTISAGGTINSGGLTNLVLVTWNTAGANTISVNYTNANGCSALLPTVYNVTVNALPVPTITGPASVCVNSTGNLYTTEAGMTGYTWTVSAGGIITSGLPSSNTITVTWNTTGVKAVTVNYSNANNCTAATPTSYAVTVNPLPVPTISGTNTICLGAAPVIYTTQAGMTNYLWTVSAGGTIVAGGTPTSNTITINWTTTGVKAITVNYTNANLCTAVIPVSYAVTVNPVPTPTIGSNNVPCVNSTGNMYYTESGFTNYVWTVSAGGTITAGQGTFAINVTWTVAGSKIVTVNYTNPQGCPAPVPTVYNLFVDPLPNAAGAITGTGTVCAGTNGVAYSTVPVMNASSYTWTLPAGATIASGAGTINITVNFGAAAVSGNITVAGTNNCGNGPASSFPVTVNPLPAAAGTITGPASVCAGATGVNYTVPAIASATSYVWTVPAGATITSGSTTNHIVVTFGNTAGSGVITVKGTNTCGSGAVSPNFNVTINGIPAAPVVTAVGPVLTSSAPTGNQWYYGGTLIPGATSQSYTVTNNTGYYWCVVTLNGCSSPISNKVWVEVVGTPELPASASFTIYPVPNNGLFTASIRYPVDDTFSIIVYNQLGGKLFELRDVKTVGGIYDTQIDLRPIASGMYSVVFMNSEHKVVKKVLINK